MSKRTDVGDRSQARRRSTSTRKSFFLQRLRRQDIILLSGLLMFACVSLITVSLLIIQARPGLSAAPDPTGTPGPKPVHTVTYTEITGLSQYQLARQAARAWAEDAQLVSASAEWLYVVALDQVGQPAEWRYRFYSPARERLFIVTVGPDNEVTGLEHAVRITLPPPPLAADEWLIDSPAALAIWLDYGGAELLRRNPGLEVLIELRRVRHHEGPVWMVIGLDKRTQDIHIVVIDANEGLVVPAGARS